MRERNQLTLPDRVATRLGVTAGDRLLITVAEGASEATLRPLAASYAGALAGAYGRTREEAMKDVDKWLQTEGTR